MSQQVLARKFRPNTFNEIVGQQHIITAISNSIKNNRIHHAYLFTGTRGVGKTTIARILAKTMCCEKKVNNNPCNKCRSCLEINQGCFIDLFEIDAASHTKVEETKEIINRAMYPPSQAKYRIFIIDEVHMLSKHSFNALLKTLEEPPEYVIFILATTNPEKLPNTILSRCLQFNLSPLSEELISTHLQQILDKEKIKYDKKALQLIAESAKGSLRDALSITEPMITFGDNNIDVKIAQQVLGTIPEEVVTSLILHIARQQPQEMLEKINLIAQQAVDFANVITQMLNILHKAAIAFAVPQQVQYLSKQLQELLAVSSAEQIQLYYQIAIKGQVDLSYAPSARQCFEIICIRQLSFKLKNNASAESISLNLSSPSKSNKETVTSMAQQPATPNAINITKNHKTIEENTTTNINKFQSNALPTASIKKTPSNLTINNNIASNTTLDTKLNLNKENWAKITASLKLSGMSKAIIQNAAFIKFEANNLQLGINKNKESLFSKMQQERIIAALNSYLDTTLQLTLVIQESDNDSPIAQQQQQRQQKISNTKKSMLSDPIVQNIVATFDAEIKEVKIKE